MKLREPLSTSIRVSSAAGLLGLLPHYLAFYWLHSPLWTEQIAEWIMARTPSRYAVAILDDLGSWAKPWAVTGGLACLGCALFLARFGGNLGPVKFRVLLTLTIGIGLSFGLTSFFAYRSLPGNISFWLPALAAVALAGLPKAAPVEPVSQVRRGLLLEAARLGVPLLMSSGVVAVAAESFFREQRLARATKEPLELFPFLPPLDRQSFGAGLVRKAVTPVPEFYGMSKNTVDPLIDIATWHLAITLDGKILRTFRYGELLALSRELRYVTLRCISNTLKSDLMGTAQWAGVHLSQLIEPGTLPNSIMEAAFIGVEGHDDSLNLDYAFGNDAFLALGMNGKTLSRVHGFPLRLLAPSYYGCRNVKWLGEIRFVTKPYYGTWQRLGYTKEPLIHISSHIDHVQRDGDLLRFGGVSFAGTRGIKAVRVRANAGPWQEARLEPAISRYTWTRWMAQLPASVGATLEAHAQDGTGAWQELAEGNPFPTGITGPTIVIART